MDIKQQCVTEHLAEGTDYRKLVSKFGVSRSKSTNFLWKKFKEYWKLLFY